MEKYVLGFAPPVTGLEGQFNTFRLGVAWGKRLNEHDTVILVNQPRSEILARAEVVSVQCGVFSDMAAMHATRNHNYRGLTREEASQRLIASMIKRYGPHKCSENSKVTVIYLRVI
ncbi:hypothetical protein [Castellaniella sp.]|uniref:hypothetical protein n=1 Tax=Castellaniella sp. TaxID=1955812 RepID=UPI002AFED75A|nr:hypothetical protein [Castellaniella sp.]